MKKNRYLQVLNDQKIEVSTFDIDRICRRKEEQLLDLNSSLAQIVIGVRRCGKSTLCHTVLKNSGLKYAYVNFDDERLFDLKAEELNDLLEALYMVYGDFKHLFLDEIQNVRGWSLFVNRLLRQNIHLIITGSNAKLLSSELSTHLTGRYHKIELFPFSFSEYVDYKGINRNATLTKEIAFLKKAFDDYIIEGGFPELLKFENSREHKIYLSQLVESIITIDVSKRFKIRYINVLKKLSQYLIANFAQEINYKSLATLFDVGSHHTVENYIDYLVQTYLLVGINKFSYKAKTRLTAEKTYLIDTALHTHQDHNLNSTNLGWRLENIVYIELLRRKKATFSDIYYYRNGYEIDFVVCQGIEVKELIQVSVNVDDRKTFKREIGSLLKGAKTLNCSQLTLITYGESQVYDIEGYAIREVNIIEWLL